MKSAASDPGKKDELAPAQKASSSSQAGRPKEMWTSGSADERACVRSRRKLWQGDGWIVKNVTICP